MKIFLVLMLFFILNSCQSPVDIANCPLGYKYYTEYTVTDSNGKYISTEYDVCVDKNGQIQY